MSVLRTAYPNDSFTAATDGGPVTITSAGTDVPDQYVASVRAQAAAQGVLLLDGAAAGTPAAPLAQRVQVLEQLITGLLTPLVEQPQLVVGPVWPLARSGQTVPVSMAAATSGKTLTLEPGGTGSRLAVRLDVAAPGGHALTLVGSAGDTVPAVQLTAAGTIVYLEGFVGGGGWRVVGRSGGDGTVPWASVTGAPTIPTQLSQLGGSVTDQQIPDAITRDSELANGLAGKADTHSHPYASSGHTHSGFAPSSVPACEVRLTGAFTPAAVTDVFAQTGWALFGSDPFNMAVLSSSVGTFSYIRIPSGWGGRYFVRYHATSTIGQGGTHALKIALNSQNPADAVATGLAVRGAAGADGAVVDAWTPQVPLAAGDRLYWGNFLSVSAQVVPRIVDGNGNTLIGVATAFEVRYVGP